MTRFSIAVSQRVLDSEQENDTLNTMRYVWQPVAVVHRENRVDK